jgi:RNA polymerase sigma-70 factor (ECF subfamily)
MASARNLCLDRLRGRRPRLEVSTALADDGGPPDEGDVAGIVERLMAALPPGQSTVMRLRDVECMETGEIARVMGISETAVRMSLSRARSTVREKLEKILNYGL